LSDELVWENELEESSSNMGRNNRLTGTFMTVLSGSRVNNEGQEPGDQFCQKNEIRAENQERLRV
jgi:hypothetical protein